MPNHRKVNGESSSPTPSGTGEGGFLSRWRMRREIKRIRKEIIQALQEHLDAGLPLEDFIVFHIDIRVEWDVSLQSWIIKVPSSYLGDLVMEPRNRVFLTDSRGGSQEDARIKEVIGDFIDVKSGESGVIYTLDFEMGINKNM